MQNWFSSCTFTRKNQQLILFTVWLSLLIQWTSGEGTIPDVVASAGEPVTLNAPRFANSETISWYRGNSLTPATLIFSYFVPTSNHTNGNAYTGWETRQSDGSLQIRNVRTWDAGNYSVSVGFQNRSTATATRLLRVYDTGQSSILITTIFVTASVPILFATALIVGVVLLCKGRQRQKELQKGTTTFQNADRANNLEPQYENRNEQLDLYETIPRGAESQYMELKHGDQAVYHQLKRFYNTPTV